jgi:hypothetical protein
MSSSVLPINYLSTKKKGRRGREEGREEGRERGRGVMD